MRSRRLQPHHAPRFRLLAHEGERGRTLAVPGFRQARTYSCGFASALMVLRFFECDLPALDLFRKLGTGRDGTRQQSIIRVLRGHGLGANARYDVDLSRIQCEIDRGKPLIAYLGDLEHWVVVYGYARGPDRVYVADPRPEEGCEHPWETYGPRLGRFGIVCSTRRRSPRPAVDREVAPAAPAEPIEAPASEAPVQLLLPFGVSPVGA